MEEVNADYLTIRKRIVKDVKVSLCDLCKDATLYLYEYLSLGLLIEI